MSHLSTRLSIPIADLTDAADVPASLAALVAVIDTNAAWISKGTFASRPAPGTVAGKLYYATDTGAFYVTDGAAWQLVNPYPGSDLAAGVASLRTLGAGALQAASGTDARLSDTRTPSALSVVTSTIAALAVTWAKLGSATPITLQRVGYVGSAQNTPVVNAKAGRLLGPTDFSTLLGMITPRLLAAANGTTTDTSGNAVTITNNGSVPVSGSACSGIDGTSGTAFRFDNSNTQWLTAPNTMKQKYGTWGCWMKTTQRLLPTPTDQTLISMWQTTGTDNSFRLVVDGATGQLRAEVSTTGAPLVGAITRSYTIVADDQWHFVAMSWDGSKLCVFVDGVLEGTETVSPATTNIVGQGPAFQSAALLLGIGANGNGGLKFEGKISNLYVTADVLDEVCHRLLYAKKYAHTLGTQPEHFTLNVKKFYRSKTYVTADFTGMNADGAGIAQPLMGSNFEDTAWVNNFGSLANSWSTGGAPDTTGPYPFSGAQPVITNKGSFYFGGAQSVGGSDTGLPSGATPTFSYGIWMKCSTPQAGAQVLFTYGVAAANAGRGLWIDSSGVLWAGQSAQLGTGAVNYNGICDGQWHHIVVVENQSTAEAAWRKMYVDGVLVACATTALGTVTLGGALGAQIGRDLSAANFFTGYIGGFFICAAALSGDNCRDLFQKLGTIIEADRQPMDPFNCVERADANNIYWIGDDLEATDQVELIIV